MSSELAPVVWTEKAISNSIVELLQDMIVDWETEFEGAIGPETRLVADLGFESIDIVQFIVGIEERFHCKGLPYEELLMKDGRYVDEVNVNNVVSFLQRHVNS